jgi:hypothetical protein
MGQADPVAVFEIRVLDAAASQLAIAVRSNEDGRLLRACLLSSPKPLRYRDW